MSDNMKVIAKIYTDFKEKFGIPRQSGLVSTLESRIVFEPKYRNSDALRGIEEYSHLWILWKFSEVPENEKFNPTVRPPRLGGNKKMGVFATRSPYRPNPIGLSSVKLLRLEETDEGTVLIVSGADMLNGTPIYDIKPYLPYTDIHSDAVGGFADEKLSYKLEVEFPEELLIKIPESKREGLIELLSEDPRPSYIEDSERVYGFNFSEFEIKFKVKENKLKVTAVIRL
ncbi:MAG: tRNA (N6-threonylcarbamoyladenosine(37)-N6)-methyltransferase TrmO [Clostridia bacterium]|nr:tRNA (N6-threonylcarbamoyladenosine(37)-N6)-methyltransferase TrmO [Clostridia bacterium]